MATLVVIRYADQGVAEDARKSVQELEDELTIPADHVASIERDVEGRYHAHISHSGACTGKDADWGSFWGALFGMLFYAPAAGAALGQLRDDLDEEKIEKRYWEDVREKVKPGTSAVFILIEHATAGKMVDALAHYGGTMIDTSLSNTELARLGETIQAQSALLGSGARPNGCPPAYPTSECRPGTDRSWR
jgi:uncharacterized membrane protein